MGKVAKITAMLLLAIILLVLVPNLLQEEQSVTPRDNDVIEQNGLQTTQTIPPQGQSQSATGANNSSVSPMQPTTTGTQNVNKELIERDETSETPTSTITTTMHTVGIGLTLSPPPPFFVVKPDEQTVLAPIGVPVTINFTIEAYNQYQGDIRIEVMGIWPAGAWVYDPRTRTNIQGLVIDTLKQPIDVPGHASITIIYTNSSYLDNFNVLLGFIDDENMVMDTAVLRIYPLKYPSIIAYVDGPLIPLESGQVVVYPIKIEPLGEYNDTVRLEARVEPPIGAIQVSIENSIGIPPFTAYLTINVSENYSMRWIDRVYIEVRDTASKESVPTLLLIKIGQGRPETKGLLAQLLDFFAAITLPIRFTTAVATGLVISGVAMPFTLDPSIGVLQATRLITPEIWLEGTSIPEIRTGMPYRGRLISFHNTALLSNDVPAMILTPWFNYPYPCNASTMIPFLLYKKDDTNLDDLMIYTNIHYPEGGSSRISLNPETYPIRGVIEITLPQGAHKASISIGINTTEGRHIGSLSVMLLGGETCLRRPSSINAYVLQGYSVYVPVEINMPGRQLRVFDNPAFNHLVGKLYIIEGRVTDNVMETPIRGILEIKVDESAEPGYYSKNRPGDYISIETDRPGILRKRETLIPVYVYVFPHKD